MPSRFASAFIVLFWLAATGYVVHRDVWPRLFADAPPPIQIDLVDEATSRVPVRWLIYRGDEKIGSLTTELRYEEADDTFWFDNEYRQISIPYDVPGLGVVTVYVPEVLSGVRVTRDGDLREQTLAGTIEVRVPAGPRFVTLASAEADISGVVRDAVLYGHCRVDSSFGTSIDKELDPVPVPAGQVLNPMMPVNRLRGIRPGQRWVIRQVDPLARAMAASLNELAQDQSPLGRLSGPLGANQTPELVATVRSRAEALTRRNGTTVDCWVIDYRSGPNAAEATTWVAVEGDRVIRQEARLLDDTLRFERED